VQRVQLTEVLGITDTFGWNAHENQVLDTLISAAVPTLPGPPYRVPDYHGGSVAIRPQATVGEHALSLILENLPTAERPVVLIPYKANDEPYDILLMLFRESKVPLFVVISLLTDEATTSSNLTDDEEYGAQLMSVQQQRATEYFSLTGDNEPGANPQQGQITVVGKEGKEGVFDFVNLFFTTKQLSANGEDVNFLSTKIKVCRAPPAMHTVP
jgi:hypothetical protein